MLHLMCDDQTIGIYQIAVLLKSIFIFSFNRRYYSKSVQSDGCYGNCMKALLCDLKLSYAADTRACSSLKDDELAQIKILNKKDKKC